MGEVPPADGHGRRRAAPGIARSERQPELRLLSRADPDAGQRWRARDRRFRPATMLAARTLEPVDRAARKPRRLPHALDRTEARAAVHGPGGVRDEFAAE